jgi:hypothetical protein
VSAELRVPRFTIEVDGQEYEAETAVVKRFTLTTEDHGFFVADIAFSGPGWGQSLPARGLDSYDEDLGRRVGTAFGCDFIMEVVRRIGSPERAAGVRVVVLRKQLFGLIDGFARLNDDGTIDDPFLPEALANRHFPPAVPA